ncbi:MAG: type II toxin-antitoxin system Phd/YefM family antitoxin [Thermoleophilia bacterium]
MQLISSRDLKQKTSAAWQLLNEEGELVVTSHGKPIALITNISEDDIEPTIRALRRAKAQVAVSNMRRKAQQADLEKMTEGEIEAEIKATRAARVKS